MSEGQNVFCMVNYLFLIDITKISFQQSVLFNTLQLAIEPTTLNFQETTAVIHALGPILGEVTEAGGWVALGVHQCLTC